MEIRVNKLLRGMGLSPDDKKVSLLGDTINVPELSVNSKLSIEVIDHRTDIVNMETLDQRDMLDLISLRNRIETAIEKREARIQLEGAIQRLAFVGIKEIRCEGYFISKIEGEFDHTIDSKLNFEEI